MKFEKNRQFLENKVCVQTYFGSSFKDGIIYIFEDIWFEILKIVKDIKLQFKSGS